MSVETAPARPSINLSLVARPGIAIRLLDGDLQEIARETGRLDTKQPEGLYLVEWSSAGHQSQTMVRLVGREDREIHFDPSDASSSDTLDRSAVGRIALVDAVKGSLRPSERDYESSIVLVVSGESDALRQAADLGLRLYDREEVAMRANTDDAPDLALRAGEQAHCYRVKPGRYFIGFQSILGERLGQSVPALAGRQTLVFLTVSRTTLIAADGDQFHMEKDHTGVDPSRTTIVSVRGDEKDYRVRERVRLATLMSYDLANATSSLASDVVEVLDEPETDPLLKLYGALVVLSAHERLRSMTQSGTPSASGPPDLDAFWVARLRHWISDPDEPGLPTDALAACWQLQRLTPQAFDKADWDALPARMEAPPMFECGWRWAIEESVLRPTAVRGTAIVTATARSAGGTLPWLCWQLAAAKARFMPVGVSADSLPALVAQVADKAAALIGPDIQGSFVKGFKALSPDIQVTALRALQLVLPQAAEASLGAISELAVALGLPSTLLLSRLVKTSEALDSANASIPSSGPPERSADPVHPQKKAPGLARRITHRDDPQKGRFGGESRRDGFTVSAEFEKTTKNWTRVVLRVTGPGDDGEVVQFHMHDSFKPPLKTRKFKAGAAEITVTIWGGFTLGVWIPAHDVELELDLAQLSDAPRIVRDR